MSVNQTNALYVMVIGNIDWIIKPEEVSGNVPIIGRRLSKEPFKNNSRKEIAIRNHNLAHSQIKKILDKEIRLISTINSAELMKSANISYFPINKGIW